MKKSVLIYGLLIGALLIFLRVLDHFFVLRTFSETTYIGVIALAFAGLGIWIGTRFHQRRKENQHKPVSPSSSAPSPSLSPEKVVQGSGKQAAEEVEHDLSPRELEVLTLMAAGHSNQEIADQLHISLNTVKTHASKLYAKLEVSRRTQAIQKARTLQLI